jgi:hypothetical protein
MIENELILQLICLRLPGANVLRASCAETLAEPIQMGMPATVPPARWTREMFYALPDDGKRHEIIDGVHYVTPSPGAVHQIVLGEPVGC